MRTLMLAVLVPMLAGAQKCAGNSATKEANIDTVYDCHVFVSGDAVDTTWVRVTGDTVWSTKFAVSNPSGDTTVSADTTASGDSLTTTSDSVRGTKPNVATICATADTIRGTKP